MFKKNILLVAVIAATSMTYQEANAVPSFARQTGLACSSCHTVFPELTPFGRQFKLNAYTLTGTKQIDSTAASNENNLKINETPPFSVMLQTDATYSKASTPSTSANLPDQLSIFYAGEISPHMGSFIQVTLAPADGSGFSMDNTDIRYANHAGAVTYGATLNNNPTVQDVWNSSPAWGYPFTGGANVTTPMIDNMGGGVAGLGAYADWGNGLYTELTLYRDTGNLDGTALAGSTTTNPYTNARISGLAPYIRLAWNTTLGSGDTLMLGAYGMQAALYDLPAVGSNNTLTPSATHDQYTDIAVDAQYEHTMANGEDTLSAHATYTHEKQTLNFSNPGLNPTLKNTRLDAIYHWGHHATATLGLNTSSGSDNGSNGDAYSSTAWTTQASYLPWMNTKFSLQYVIYTKINGSTTNVSDSNTALAQAWFMW